ncbi:MerR family transcriptional regulator [Paludibacterium paludis]|uniref:MerR family transcriptional regulator n=1 Tax=Paludibacterium paludis TaxID=1225769 RepID=A0A918P835_9NEIS|nr:MerR family transcriptional regulator [Paludibacterium paludis]GGY29982.1 MerR family transcriptional regulator [Paludibacterium paludis]
MLIGEFARRSGLSQDTVRFYVRKGLLQPRRGRQGRSHGYHEFSERDVALAALIRFAQSLGLSLQEIGDVTRELLWTGISPEREVALLDAQLAKLAQKAAELEQLAGYLRGKRDWIASGRSGDEPRFAGLAPCLASLIPPAAG